MRWTFEGLSHTSESQAMGRPRSSDTKGSALTHPAPECSFQRIVFELVPPLAEAEDDPLGRLGVELLDGNVSEGGNLDIRVVARSCESLLGHGYHAQEEAWRDAGLVDPTAVQHHGD